MSDAKALRARQRGLTALQRHAAFFDTDGDGIITPEETAGRMRDLGVPAVIRAAFVPVVHAFLSRLTERKDSSISLERITLGKHAFDTGVYDSRGEVDEQAFEALFARGGAAGAPCVTRKQMRAIIRARGDRDRRYGRFGAVMGYLFSGIEVWILYVLAHDAEKREGFFYRPALTRRRLRSFYEGHLFFALERRTRMRRAGVHLPKGKARRYD